MKLLLCLAALGFAALAPSASASTITVDVTDTVYGNFSGSIADGATGSAATLTWQSAGYFWTGNIGITDSSGIIFANIVTNNDDTYVLSTVGSGDPSLGSECISGGTTACVVATGSPQSLYSTVNSMNGGQGICCGGSDIVLTASGSASLADAPEPGSIGLFAIGALGLVGYHRGGRAMFTRKFGISRVAGPARTEGVDSTTSDSSAPGTGVRL